MKAHAHDAHDGHPHVSTEGRVARWADRIGAVVGFACAVHCALVPVLLALAPAMGVGFLDNEAFEAGLLAVAGLVATVAIIHAVRRQHPRSIIAGLLAGFGLLLAGLLVEHDAPLLGTVLSVLGGVVLAISHLRNSRCHRDACDVPHAHDHAH